VKSLADGLRLKRREDAEEGYQSMLGINQKKVHNRAVLTHAELDEGKWKE
jgi:hypothetical protein